MELDIKGAGTNLVMQYALSRFAGANRKDAAKQAGLGLAAGVVIPSNDMYEVRAVTDAVRVFREATGKVKQLSKDVESSTTFQDAVQKKFPTADEYVEATEDIERLANVDVAQVQQVIAELTQLEESIRNTRKDVIVIFNELMKKQPSTSARDLI